MVIPPKPFLPDLLKQIDPCKLCIAVLESTPHFMICDIIQKMESTSKYVKVNICSIHAMHNVRHEIKSDEIYT